MNKANLSRLNIENSKHIVQSTTRKPYIDISIVSKRVMNPNVGTDDCMDIDVSFSRTAHRGLDILVCIAIFI